MVKSVYFYLVLALMSLTVGYAQKECKGIIEDYDKFTKTTKYYTDPIQAISFIKEGDDVYMSIRLTASTRFEGNGAMLMLDNGEVLDYNVKVESRFLDIYQGVVYNKSAIVRLDAADIDKLTHHSVTDIKLHVYEGELKKKLGIRFMEELNCLVDKY